MLEIERYYVSLKDLDTNYFKNTSIVDRPANQMEFVRLSEEGEKIQLSNLIEEKRMITGVLLIPEQDIIRQKKDGTLYNISFKLEAIEEIRDVIFIQKKQSAINLDHKTPVENVDIVEAWTSLSSEFDKSTVLGFKNLPIGTLFISMKINNLELWEKIKEKNSRYNGFSIEALLRTDLQLFMDDDAVLISNIKGVDELIEKIPTNNLTPEIKKDIEELLININKIIK